MGFVCRCSKADDSRREFLQNFQPPDQFHSSNSKLTQFSTPYTMSKSLRYSDRSEDSRPKKRKRFQKQLEYHSSSEEDEPGADVNAIYLHDSDEHEDVLNKTENNSFGAGEEEEKDGTAAVQDGEDDSEETGASSDSDADTTTSTKKRKRNDPDAFATSMSKILGSKLSSTKRSDPVLSRSKTAETITKELAEAKLEQKARHKIRQEKREALERGRIKDILGLESTEINTAHILEQERKLKKTAQRGVIKLFNAVRAAQVRGEEAAREAKRAGVVGMAKREEKVNEMSKKGFLELIAGGGKRQVSMSATPDLP